MPLFHSKRDASFLNSISRELIARIVDVEIYIYKIALDKTQKNLYEEAIQKWYNPAVRIPCLINRQPQAWNGDDLGQNYTQTAEFAFHRDILVDANVLIEVGDVFQYNGEWYEVSSVVENQYFGGKNPDHALSGQDWGFNIGLVISAQVTRRRIQTIEKTYSGNNTDSAGGPRGI